MTNKIRGVIFDFNGTLFFDSDKHEKAWKLFSKEARSHSFSDKEILTHVHGRTNKSILEYLFQKELCADVLAESIVKKEVIYRKSCLEDPDNLKLAAGATELFEFLINRQIKMTIATASDMTNLKFFNEQFQLNRWFDMDKIVYDNGQINGKPAPDMFLKASEMIEVPPSQCLVFEDSESGVLAAKNAGVAKIIVIDQRGKKSDFQEHPFVLMILPDFKNFPKSIFA